MGPQPILYIQIGYMFLICTVLVGWDHWLYYIYTFCVKIPNEQCVTCMGPLPIHYTCRWDIFSVYAFCKLHGTTGYFIHTFWMNIPYVLWVTSMGPHPILYTSRLVYFHYMHCFSYMGPQAILYIHFG